MQGSVKRFNKTKGFGFITSDENKDYFFHFSELEMEGFKTIAVGKRVEFDVVETERGPQAHKIQKIVEID